MIDMPDHVAEKQGNRVAWMWPLVTLLGITLSVVAGMASYGYTTAQAEKRFADVVDYVDRVGNVGVSAPTADRQTQAAPVLESGIAT